MAVKTLERHYHKEWGKWVNKILIGETRVSLGKDTIIFIIFETLCCFPRFSFHHKWIDELLLLINMVNKSCLKICPAT